MSFVEAKSNCKKKANRNPQRLLIPLKAITTVVSASDNTSSTSPDI